MRTETRPMAAVTSVEHPPWLDAPMGVWFLGGGSCAAYFTEEGWLG